jgi:hypothetical protein
MWLCECLSCPEGLPVLVRSCEAPEAIAVGDIGLEEVGVELEPAGTGER